MKNLELEIKKYSEIKVKKSCESFFKTGVGEYGEGDIFLGVKVPKIREIIKDFLKINFEELEKFFHSKYHEVRFGAIIILVKKYAKSETIEQKQKILNFYIENIDGVNNWDLVDISAHNIIGKAILENIITDNILNKYSSSKNLWYQRIAILSTWTLIKNSNFGKTLEISRKLLDSKYDLIHKSIGWMLREVWKKDNKIIEDFIIENYDNIPRTALRYSIEKMDKEKRKLFLNKDFLNLIIKK